MLRILLVEDSALFCSAVSNVLAGHGILNLTACSSSSFVKKAAEISHHVVIIDAVTWAASQRALVETVQRTSISTPVILLGREDLLESYLEVLRAGAVGFLKQTASPQMVIKAVRAVATGGVWFERSLFRKIFLQVLQGEKKRGEISLSSKERQILNFVAGGKTNKEIGTYVGLAERSVKAYVSNLFRKVGVPNRSALSSFAVRHGLA